MRSKMRWIAGTWNLPMTNAHEPRQEMEVRELVTIRQFRDLPEALLAKGSLESAGIECFLADDNLVRLDWFISNFIGGIKLNVRAADAANAQNLLDEPILEGLYVQGVGLYEQPRCPHCQSLDVNFQELDRPIAYMSAFLHMPMPVQRPAWRCHACDAEWEDDGTEGGRADPHKIKDGLACFEPTLGHPLKLLVWQIPCELRPAYPPRASAPAIRPG